MNANPDLVLKVHSLLAESNPAVLAYAAQLGDQHVIKEYLKNFPNEVFIVILKLEIVAAKNFTKNQLHVPLYYKF